MDSLDAKVITEPANAWNAASSLRSISTTVGEAGDDISSARNQVASECTSQTTDAALSALSSQRTTLDSLSQDTSTLATALTTFGNSMDSVKNRLGQVVADATAAELTVSGSLVRPPDDASDENYETKKATFDELKETLYLIRQDESSAHDTLISSCDSLKSAGEWFRDKYLPSGDVGDVSKVTGWASRLSTGASWAAVRSIAVFQPRYPKWHPRAGAFMSVADRSKMGPLATLWAKTKARNWVNRPYTRGTTAWKVQQAANRPRRHSSGPVGRRRSCRGRWPAGTSTRRTRPTPAWERGRRSPVPGRRPSPRVSAGGEAPGWELRPGPCSGLSAGPSGLRPEALLVALLGVWRARSSGRWRATP